MTTLVRPRPVFCVNEHEHRDRELANAVADGVFSFAGVTLATRPRTRLAATPTSPRTRSGGSTG